MRGARGSGLAVPRGQEGDVVGHRCSFGLGEAGKARVGCRAHPESGKLVCQAGERNPTQAFEEVNEGDVRDIRCPEQVGRSRPRPGRTGGIKKGSNVSGIAAHGG